MKFQDGGPSAGLGDPGTGTNSYHLRPWTHSRQLTNNTISYPVFLLPCAWHISWVAALAAAVTALPCQVTCHSSPIQVTPRLFFFSHQPRFFKQRNQPFPVTSLWDTPSRSGSVLGTECHFITCLSHAYSKNCVILPLPLFHKPRLHTSMLAASYLHHNYQHFYPAACNSILAHDRRRHGLCVTVS